MHITLTEQGWTTVYMPCIIEAQKLEILHCVLEVLLVKIELCRRIQAKVLAELL